MPLKGAHRRHRVGHIIAKTFERHHSARVGPVRIGNRFDRAERQLVPGQQTPVEQFPRILLPGGGDVGMANDIGGRDAVPRHNVLHQQQHRLHLRLGEGPVPELMPGIDDLDADAGGVDVADPAPVGQAGVPGPHLLRHHADHSSVLGHQIMGGNLRSRIGQPFKRCIRRFHTGIVQDEDADRRPVPGVEIGGRRLDHPAARRSRACAVRTVMMAMPISIRTPPPIMRGVNGVCKTSVANTTARSGATSVRDEIIDSG